MTREIVLCKFFAPHLLHSTARLIFKALRRLCNFVGRISDRKLLTL
nr:MAG TPA: hypothetical protein [Caudoviricetes sp.]